MLIASCANQVSPSGGPKDAKAPVMNIGESTPSMQTNFKKQKIELAFDEWVRVNRPTQEVIVTPPLQYKPEIYVKGKKVIFNFDDEEILRENATYIINFGKSIVDITEGNETPTEFVFSTGDKIDSLSLNGVVLDPDQKPAKDYLVLLHDNLSDSSIVKNRPFYVTRSDEKGIFKFDFLKSDTFNIFALKDENNNYRYDYTDDQLGFIDKPIITNDSSMQKITLITFLQDKNARVVSKRSSTNRSWVLLNVPAENIAFEFEDLGQFKAIHRKNDSLIVWHSHEDSLQWDLYLSQDQINFDTISITSIPTYQTYIPKVSGPSSRRIEVRRGIGQIKFDIPIQGIDPDFIRFAIDSTAPPLIREISIDSLDTRRINFSMDWQENQEATLLLDSLALASFLGTSNDSIRLSLQKVVPADLGDISLKVHQASDELQYIIQLKQGSDIIGEPLILMGDSTYTHKWLGLKPKEYSMEIIFDRNQNGRWDSGNYENSIQPEKRYTESVEKLRAEWEVEKTIDLSQLANKK